VNTVLKNIVRFTGLIVGAPVALPHKLNIDNGTPVTPRLVVPNVNGVTIAADAVNITATRQASGPASVDVYVEFWHTIESVTPPGNLAGLVPFIVEPGGGGSGGTANPMALPAQWFFGAAAANTPLTPMFMRPTNVGNIDTLKMMRDGWTVGFSVRFIDINTGLPATVTAGSLSTVVMRNGLATLSQNHLGGSQGGQITVAPGVYPYVPDDLISMQWTTDVDFAADTDQLYMFCWIEVFEAVP
jgi:hypothetical protein